MRYLSEIFWRHSWNVCRLFLINCEFFVCLSVCWLAYFLTEIRLIQGCIQFQMRYLSEIFLRHSQDISGSSMNHFQFLVCLSVCQLTYCLTEIKLILGYIQFQMRYLSEICWWLSWNVCTLDPHNSEFVVCLSVYWLAYFLTKIMSIQGYLQFWIRYISEFFWRHSWDVGTLFPNNFEFLVCLSVCQLAYFLTEIT